MTSKKSLSERDICTKYIQPALEKCADEGIENIEDIKILRVNPLDQFGLSLEIVKIFSGKK